MEGAHPMMKVEILCFEGCPHVTLATSRATQAIKDTRADAELYFVPIETEEQAVACRFLGSPSVRVDGKDVDGSADNRADFGLQCRVYSTGELLEGAPPISWIEAALRGARGPGTSVPTADSCCSSATKG
jgi:hypothetical protein